MSEADRVAFAEHCWQSAATVSLWPKWKRNVLGTTPDMPPRPVEVTEGIYSDLVPALPGKYWLRNRHTPEAQVIASLYPELGFDWTHYWQAGPQILPPATDE